MAVPPPTPPSVQASVDLLSPAYWAFVSYAHLDNRQEGRMWASWLCQRLETFEIPEEFVGQHNEKGDLIPERLSPIFRDEEELPAGHDLSEAIYAALERSKFLIVICSRNAVKSDHVAQEILYFKQLGRADRILAVMIDGEPNASWNEAIQRKGSSPYDECFPDSLIHPLTTQDKEGVLDKERTTEPIASDFRLPGGLAQGWTHSSFYRTSLEGEGSRTAKAVRNMAKSYQERLDLGLHKTIAGIVGLPVKKITEGSSSWKLKKARGRAKALWRWLCLTAALLLLTLVSGALAFFNYQEAQKNERLARVSKERSQKLASAMTFQVVQGLRDYVPGIKREPILGSLLAFAEEASIEEGLVSDPTELRLLIAISHEAGEKALRDGDSSIAKQKYGRAENLIRRLLESQPEDPVYRRDLSINHEKQGEYHLYMGQSREAEKHFQESSAIREALFDANEDSDLARQDLSVIRNKLGSLFFRNGDTKMAETFFQGALKLRRPQQRSGGDLELRRDRSIGYNNLGDLYLERFGKTEDAQDFYEKALEDRRFLVEMDAANSRYRRDLTISLEKLGDLAFRRSDAEAAKEFYLEAYDERENLANLDSKNVQFRRDLTVICERMAKLHFLLREDDAAQMWVDQINEQLEFFEVNAIESGETRRSLIVVENMLGDFALREERLKDAKGHYKDAQEETMALLDEDPQNREFKRDLAVSFEKLGDLTVEQENYDEAIEHYQETIEITKGLLETDEQSLQYQKDLISSHMKITRAYILAPSDDNEVTEKIASHYSEVEKAYRALDERDLLSGREVRSLESWAEKLEESAPTGLKATIQAGALMREKAAPTEIIASGEEAQEAPEDEADSEESVEAPEGEDAAEGQKSEADSGSDGDESGKKEEEISEKEQNSEEREAS